MLLVADVKKELQIQMSKEDRSIPAVTHVDYSDL